MWMSQKANIICGYLEDYENQKRHIERVLSAKEVTKSRKSPYYPDFLRLRISNVHREEEKNDRLREFNNTYISRILNIESNLSNITAPKKCPAFDKTAIYLKRIRKETKNCQEIIKFYEKLGNIHSNFSVKEFEKRKMYLDSNCRMLQKSIFDISPALFFISPSKIKNFIEKYKNSNLKRCPSSSGMTGGTSKYNNSKNLKKNEGEQTTDNSHNEATVGNKNESNNKSKNEKTKSKNEKINTQSSKKKSGDSYKQSTSKKSNNSNNQNSKKKRPQSALRRNESEVNLLI